MRSVQVGEITKNIKEMCIEANYFLSPDMKKVFDESVKKEESPLGKQILHQLEENLEIALTAESVKKALETYNKCNDIMEQAVKDVDELSQIVDEMDPDLFNIDDTVLTFPLCLLIS